MNATDRETDGAGWEAARRDLQRAYLLVSFGHVDPAIEACRRADRRIDGDHHLPKTLAGNFQIAAGELRAALRTLREVTRAHPQAALPQAHFAEACLLAGRQRQGERALATARELDDGEHTELIDRLEAAWRGIAPDEVPPPVEIADTGPASSGPTRADGGRHDDR